MPLGFFGALGAAFGGPSGYCSSKMAFAFAAASLYLLCAERQVAASADSSLTHRQEPVIVGDPSDHALRAGGEAAGVGFAGADCAGRGSGAGPPVACCLLPLPTADECMA